jgi:hypothetical protein
MYASGSRFYSRDKLDIKDNWASHIDDLGDPNRYEGDELPLEECEGYQEGMIEGYAYMFTTRDGWHIRRAISRRYLPVEIQLNDEKVEQWQKDSENIDKRGIVSQDGPRERFWSATTITRPTDESLAQPIQLAHTGPVSENDNDELPPVIEV